MLGKPVAKEVSSHLITKQTVLECLAAHKATQAKPMTPEEVAIDILSNDPVRTGMGARVEARHIHRCHALLYRLWLKEQVVRSEDEKMNKVYQIASTTPHAGKPA